MNEKSAFHQRLLLAFKRARIDTNSPTKLATAFNLRHTGQSVTTQAVHKWLSGTSIPGQAKLRTLASWLGVSPEWLRYGDPSQKPGRDGLSVVQNLAPYVVTEDSIGPAFSQLSEEHKQVVCGVIATLLGIESEQRR